jgi:hypothetical protein
MKLSFDDVKKLLDYIRKNGLEEGSCVSFTDKAIYTGKEADEVIKQMMENNAD